MRQRLWKKVKQTTASVLIGTLLLQQTVYAAPQSAKARFFMLPEHGNKSEFAAYDTFYLATTEAQLKEGKSYLLKIERGGDCKEEASVSLKFSDITASYNTDYMVRLHDGWLFKQEADVPADHTTLLDEIKEAAAQGQTEQNMTEEEIGEAKKNYQELYEKFVSSQLEASRIESGSNPEKIESGSNSEKIAAGLLMADEIPTTASPFSNGEGSAMLATGSNGSLRAAKSFLLGEESDRIPMEGGENTVVQALSDFSDSLIAGFNGAMLEVPFEAGERSAEVEIITFDNDNSDGDRIFNVVLTEPSEGYTSSAVSEGIFTILDDEEPETITVGFGEPYYEAEDGTAYVDVYREGGINQAVSVKIQSEAVSAVSGKDFSPVRADVFFPFGIEKRTLEIPVSGKGLEETVSFLLKLSSQEERITFSEEETEVWISPEDEESGIMTVSQESEEELEARMEAGARLREQARGLSSDTAREKYSGLIMPRTWGNFSSISTTATGVKLEGKEDGQGATLAFETGNLYAYDGLRFEWKKESGRPNYGRQRINAETAKNGWKTLYESDDSRWSERTTTLRFNELAVRSVHFNFNRDIVRGWFNVRESEEVKNFQWIHRNFHVNLLPAFDTPQFISEDGTYKEDPKAVEVSIEGGGNSKTLTTKNGFNRIAITKKSDKMRLVGLEISKNATDKKRKIINLSKFAPKDWSEDGNTIVLELSNEFLNEYSKERDSFITYTTDEKSHITEGSFCIRPIFEYYDTKITVSDSPENPKSGAVWVKYEDSYGWAREHILSPGQTLTLHKGDKPKFTVRVNADKQGVLRGSGVYVNSSLGGGRKNDISVRPLVDGYCYLEKDPLRENQYRIEPVYAFKGNGIRVRIHKDDLSKFKDAGIFARTASGEYVAPYTKKGDYYEFYPTGKEAEVEKEYPLAVELKDNSSYGAVWKTSQGYYAGSSMIHKGRDSAAGNLLELYAASDLQNVTLGEGAIFYENRNLRNLSNTEKSVSPAKGAALTVNGQTAVAGEKGTFETIHFSVGTKLYPCQEREDGTLTRSSSAAKVGIGSDRPLKVQYTMNCDSVSQTEELLLVKPDIIKGYQVLGNLEVDSLMYDGPHFTDITVTRDNVGCETILIQDGVPTEFAVAVEGDGKEYSYYKKGQLVKAKENIKDVSLVVLDKGGKELHKVKLFYDKGARIWKGTEYFAPGNSYVSGDRAYLQLTTDRKSGDDRDENLYVYRPVDTGYLLYEESAEPKEPQELNFGTLGEFGSLPLIGSFNTTMDLGYVRLGTEPLRDDQGKIYGTRLSIGGNVAWKGFASANHSLADDGVNYGGTLDKLKNIKSTFKAAKNSISTLRNLGKENPDLASGTAASLGSPQWAIIPKLGFYLDFTMRGTGTDDAGNELSNGGLSLCGGGVFAGVSGKFGLNNYFIVPVVFIPCYFGTKIEGEILLQFGGKARFNVNDKDMTKPELNLADPKLMKYTGTETFKAYIQVHGGIGIAGAIGVRGLIGVETMFMLAQNYLNDGTNDRGFEVAAIIGLEIDALLATIPYTYELAKIETGLIKKISKYEEEDEEEAGGKKERIGSSLATESNATYSLKERNGLPSSWQGSSKERAGFGGMQAWTLQKNGFDHPSGQFLELSGGEALYLFLADDPDRPAEQRTVLAYSIYDGTAFSKPLIIQDDGRADFSPAMCKVGDEVLIVWASEGIEDNKLDGEFDTDNVKNQEIYGIHVKEAELLSQAKGNHSAFAPFDLSQAKEKIERLSNDNFYDSDPVAVYEEKSGKSVVFYLKTEALSSSADLIDYVNPNGIDGETYSTIVYKIYDHDTGKWEENAVLSEEDEELLRAFDGQHFLLSPIHDEKVQENDPVITDLTAAASDGRIVLAYTVDADHRLDTDHDREIYQQWITVVSGDDQNGKEQWEVSEPVAITSDVTSDSKPQLVVRNQDGASANIWMFWMADGKDIKYFDLDEYVEKCLEADPDLEDVDEAALVEEACHLVDVNKGDETREYHMAGFQAAVDEKDNVYLIWADEAEASDGEDGFCQELYGMGLVETRDYAEVPKGNGTETPEEDQQDSEDSMDGIEYPSDGEIETEIRDTVRTWSLPNRLTHTDEVVDEPVFMVNSRGQLLICYNQYRMDIDLSDKEDPVKLSDYKHQAAILQPTGAVETKEILLSDEVPEAGQEVEVTVRTVNMGMTTAEKGYEVTVYEQGADGAERKITDWKGGTSPRTLLIPAEEESHTFTWTVPQKVAGTRLRVETTEIGMSTPHIAETEPLEEKPVYELSGVNAHQLSDGSFAVDLELVNTGNLPTKPGDYVLARFDGPFGTAEDFGLSDDFLGETEISLQPGEGKDYRIPFTVGEQAFDLYGFIDVNVNVRNHDDSNTEEAVVDRCFLEQPPVMTINGESEELTVKVGETVSLEAEFGESQSFDDVKVFFVPEDSEIFTAGTDTLTGLSVGESLLFVHLEGYDSYRTIRVKVVDGKAGGEDEENGDDGPEYSSKDSYEMSEAAGSGAYIQSSSRNENGELLISQNGDRIFRKNDRTYARNEWQQVDGKWYYFGESKLALKGWVKTWSGWYYLSPVTAAMGTGWIFIGNEWYYLDPETGVMKTGWRFIDGKWYYLDLINGDMKTGWRFIDGKWYYLDPINGDMKTGWRLIDGRWYFFDSVNGHMYHSQTVEGKYRLAPEGHWLEG